MLKQRRVNPPVVSRCVECRDCRGDGVGDGLLRGAAGGVAETFANLAGRHDPARAHLAATEHSMALEGQAAGDLKPVKPTLSNP